MSHQPEAISTINPYEYLQITRNPDDTITRRTFSRFDGQIWVCEGKDDEKKEMENEGEEDRKRVTWGFWTCGWRRRRSLVGGGGSEEIDGWSAVEDEDDELMKLRVGDEEEGRNRFSPRMFLRFRGEDEMNW